jgi:hypothetical protein
LFFLLLVLTFFVPHLNSLPFFVLHYSRDLLPLSHYFERLNNDEAAAAAAAGALSAKEAAAAAKRQRRSEKRLKKRRARDALLLERSTREIL